MQIVCGKTCPFTFFNCTKNCERSLLGGGGKENVELKGKTFNDLYITNPRRHLLSLQVVMQRTDESAYSMVIVAKTTRYMLQMGSTVQWLWLLVEEE